MLKKILSFVLMISFFASSAEASSRQGLKIALDELNYALTVAWDQEDQVFHDEALNTFTAAVGELQANGLSNKDFVEFLMNNIKDEKISADMEEALAMAVARKMSPAEASILLRETLDKSYNSGAQWGMPLHGKIIFGVLSGLSLTFLISAWLVALNCARVEYCEG